MDLFGGGAVPKNAMIALYALAGVAVVAFFLFRRGGSRRSATARSIEGTKHWLTMIVFQHSRKIVRTEGVVRYGTVSHDVFQGVAVTPTAITSLRSGGTWGVIPKLPPLPPDATPEIRADWERRGRLRELNMNRLRPRTQVISMREGDASPIDFPAGRDRGYRRGNVSSEHAKNVANSAVQQAEGNHIRFGALGDDSVKMFAWLAIASAVLALGAWGAVVGFRAWQTFQK